MSRLIKSISLKLPSLESSDKNFEFFWKKKENQNQLKEFLKIKQTLKAKKFNDLEEFKKKFSELSVPYLKIPLFKSDLNELRQLRKKFYSSVSSEINSFRKEEQTKEASVQVEPSSFLTNDASFSRQNSFLYRSGRSTDCKIVNKVLKLNLKKISSTVNIREASPMVTNLSPSNQGGANKSSCAFLRIKKLKKIKTKSLRFRNPLIQDKVFSREKYLKLDLKE